MGALPLGDEEARVLAAYKEYLASKAVVLFVVGFDLFEAATLEGVLSSLGAGSPESVGKRLPGFESGVLLRESKGKGS